MSTDLETAPRRSLRQLPRRYIAFGVIIVAIFLLGTLVLVRDNFTPTSTPTTETFNAAPSSLVNSLASVPASVYNAVGVSSPAAPITPLRPTTGSGNAPSEWLATLNAGAPEPVVFFYGAEFAPYAAAERWPLVLALSRFGTFRQIGLMQSSSSTAFPDLSTFTFYDTYYTSKYVILESVERYSSLNPTGARYLGLQLPDVRQSAVVADYGSSDTAFPLLDIANRYVLNGSSFTPAVLVGLTQDQIAGDLTSTPSPLTQAVVSAANEITASICAVDGQKPANVCHSRGVDAADDALKIKPPA
ncbi:MAG TPA: DUF929 family protein [Acidimicrobiales bacterium]|jgi:hypothetical protein|nr:DUF929 family protein [Acidimicrobiales bacterium]